jgi:tRNA (cytidine32/uridine32-2'-O)-methyltransferase
MNPVDLNKIRIVLVNTTHPGNIGATARAMKNMGLTSLYLVEPLKFPHDKAIWRSASASDVVEKAVVVDTLDEAIADCSLVIGTSARDRRIPWPLIDPAERGQLAAQESAHHEVAILFGREARGLKNEELQKCQYHVHIPTSDDYSSLNLAMAVQVISYEIRKSILAVDEEAPAANQETGKVVATSDIENSPLQHWDQEFSTNEDLELFFKHLEEVLVLLDFHDPDNPRQLMTRLRRLYQRVRLDKMEMNILRGILTSVQQKIRQ